MSDELDDLEHPTLINAIVREGKGKACKAIVVLNTDNGA